MQLFTICKITKNGQFYEIFQPISKAPTRHESGNKFKEKKTGFFRNRILEWKR